MPRTAADARRAIWASRALVPVPSVVDSNAERDAVVDSNAERDAVVETLALRLGFETLQKRHRDHLNFHTVAVWSVKEALEAAYQAGLDAAKRG